MRPNAKSSRLKQAALITLFSISITSTASAQTTPISAPDRAVRLALKDTVWLVDATEREGMNVQGGRADAVWNGALIGAGVGLAAGIALCRATEPWENCRDDVGPMLGFAAIGAGAGIAIDALLNRRSIVYDASPGSKRLHAGPIFGGGTRGVRVSLRF